MSAQPAMAGRIFAFWLRELLAAAPNSWAPETLWGGGDHPLKMEFGGAAWRAALVLAYGSSCTKETRKLNVQKARGPV